VFPTKSALCFLLDTWNSVPSIMQPFPRQLLNVYYGFTNSCIKIFRDLRRKILKLLPTLCKQSLRYVMTEIVFCSFCVTKETQVWMLDSDLLVSCSCWEMFSVSRKFCLRVTSRA
jgi:hypothetical protein